MSAAEDRERYIKAMIGGDFALCVRIEKAYDLYGYTPELVAVGMSAICEGKEPHQAIENYQHEYIDR